MSHRNSTHNSLSQPWKVIFLSSICEILVISSRKYQKKNLFCLQSLSHKLCRYINDLLISLTMKKADGSTENCVVCSCKYLTLKLFKNKSGTWSVGILCAPSGAFSYFKASNSTLFCYFHTKTLFPTRMSFKWSLEVEEKWIFAGRQKPRRLFFPFQACQVGDLFGCLCLKQLRDTEIVVQINSIKPTAILKIQSSSLSTSSTVIWNHCEIFFDKSTWNRHAST